MSVVGALKIAGAFLGDNVTKILTGVAVVGVVVTTVVATKNHAKAQEAIEQREIEHQDAGYTDGLSKMDKFLTAAPCYIPTVVCAIVTCGCIIAAEMLNATTIAGMTAAGALAKKELADKESEINRILNGKTGVVADPSGFDMSLLPGEGKTLCVDEYCGHKFWCSTGRLRAIEAELNKIASSGWVPYKKFFDFVGIEDDCTSENLVGWNTEKFPKIDMSLLFERAWKDGEEIPVAKVSFPTLMIRDYKDLMSDDGSLLVGRVA